MQTRTLQSKLLTSTVLEFGDTRLEVYVTLHNPYSFAYDPSSSTEFYQEEDPPEKEDQVFVTLVTVDVPNEITELRKVVVMD